MTESVYKQIGVALAPAMIIGCFSWFMAMNQLAVSNGLQDAEIASLRSSVENLDSKYDTLNGTVLQLVVKMENVEESLKEIKDILKDMQKK